MIEVVFNDSTAEALKCVKQMITGEETAVCLEGETEEERLLSVGAASSEFGPKIPGCAQDVLSLHLLADMGDISRLEQPESRHALYAKWLTAYEKAADYTAEIQRFEDMLKNHIRLLKMAAETETPIRFWWSDAPSEICGLYWAMHFLKGTRAPLRAIRIPRYAQVTPGSAMIVPSTSSLAPEDFYNMITYEQEIPAGEQEAMAREWQTLVKENAPLRADVNGMLLSVPVDFYDAFLLRHLPDTPFYAANIIGQAMAEKAIGIDAWWYRDRLLEMKHAGILRRLPTPENLPADMLYLERVKESCH